MVGMDVWKASVCHWEGITSLKMIRDIFPDRMFSLTMEGLTKAMKELKGKKVRA